MPNKIGRIAIALMALGVAFGCASEQVRSSTAVEPQPQSSEPVAASTPSEPVAATAFASSSRPAQKTANLTIEGETEEMLLTLYDEVAAPFTTYFPAESVIADGSCSSEGCGFRFSAKTETGEANDAAYLHFFFPSESPTAEQIEKMYVRDEGSLFARSDNWQPIETDNPSQEYPGVKQSTRFLNTETNRTGQLSVGEAQGQVFVAIEMMEAEFVEGFSPRFAAIYENLEFRAPAAQP